MISALSVFCRSHTSHIDTLAATKSSKSCFISLVTFIIQEASLSKRKSTCESHCGHNYDQRTWYHSNCYAWCCHVQSFYVFFDDILRPDQANTAKIASIQDLLILPPTLPQWKQKICPGNIKLKDPLHTKTGFLFGLAFLEAGTWLYLLPNLPLQERFHIPSLKGRGSLDFLKSGSVPCTYKNNLWHQMSET